ncbi:MAG: hypothetical protein WKF83_05285 [Nocardioidaceae bacterium]
MVENKFYADLAGTVTTQQRVRLAPELTIHGIDRSGSRFDSMTTLAPPVGRGYEYVTGGYDWDTELAELPDLLGQKLAAPTVEPGTYDLVVDPTEPVADDPRVDRPRHRARPSPGVRGQLRRHLVRHVRQARVAAVRLRAPQRHW